MSEKAICHVIVIKIMPRLQLNELNVQTRNDMNTSLETTEKSTQGGQQEHPHEPGLGTANHTTQYGVAPINCGGEFLHKTLHEGSDHAEHYDSAKEERVIGNEGSGGRQPMSSKQCGEA